MKNCTYVLWVLWLCMCWWQSSWQAAEAILREAASPMMCKAGLERVTSKRCQDFSLRIFSFFRDAYCNISLQTEITSKDPSRVKFDHGVPFFWFIAFHFTAVDHGFNGVVWVTPARLVHSMPLLPLCHKLHHPCRLGTNSWILAPQCRLNVAIWKTPETMMSHVALVALWINVFSFGSAIYCGSSPQLLFERCRSTFQCQWQLELCRCLFSRTYKFQRHLAMQT